MPMSFIMHKNVEHSSEKTPRELMDRFSFSIKHLLEKQDRKVFRKVSGIDRHPLMGLLPKKKVSTYNLRDRTSQYPV